MALAFARQAFEPFLVNVQREWTEVHPEEQLSYWNDAQTPYRTFYAFEEVAAAFKDQPRAHDTLPKRSVRLP